MQLTPVIAIHMTAALAALAIGPVALWALFIRDYLQFNIAGYTWIHLFVPLTLAGLFGAFRALYLKDISRHHKIMQGLYFGACIGAGAFTLLPGRYLGQLVWGQWLGLL
jgi:uncharacterized membrane protein